MESQSDSSVGSLRRRRSRFSRVLRYQISLDHNPDEKRPVLLSCVRVGAHIRQSLQRSERVSSVAFNLNAFSQQDALTNSRLFVTHLDLMPFLMKIVGEGTKRTFQLAPSLLAPVLPTTISSRKSQRRNESFTSLRRAAVTRKSR